MKNSACLFALLTAAQTVSAQCPAIEFFTARQTITTTHTDAIAAYRTHTASFFAGRFPIFGNGGGLLEVIPDFERHLIGCFQKKMLGRKISTAKDYSSGMGSQRAQAVEITDQGTYNYVWVPLFGNAVQVSRGRFPATDLNTTNYAVGNRPVTALFVDVNADKIPDLLTVNFGADPDNQGSVSVLLGNGDGTYKQAVNYSAGVAPVSMSVGDFNGDGKLDIAVGSSGASKVSFLAGNGDGTFKTAVDSPTAGPVLGIANADLNGDGKADIIAVSEASVSTAGNQLQFLAGNGDGTFKAATKIPLAATSYYVAVGDFNLDGKADLAVTNWRSATVSVLLGNGDGTFGPEKRYVASDGPMFLVIADVTGDGYPDILVAEGTPEVLMADTGSYGITALLGNGDGTFQGAPVYPTDPSPSALVAADLNGDGKLDLIAAGQFGETVQTYLGNGAGGFGAPVSSKLTSPNGQAGPHGFAVADFNGDGKQDLAVAESFGNGVGILAGLGDGTFQPPAYTATSAPALAIVTADFNGDHKPDLAAAVNVQTGATGTPGVLMMLNDGSGSFQSAVLGGVGNPVHLAAADLNGDGNADLVVLDSGDVVSGRSGAGYVLLGKGDGTFQTPVSYAASDHPIWVSIGDLNADGKLDLVVATEDKNFNFQIAVLLGNGNGTFKPAVIMPTDFGPTAIAINDFSGDGIPDLVISHCCGATQMSYMVGKGDGTFQPEVFFNGGDGNSAMVMADFNGDGMADIAVTNSSNPSNVAVLLNAKKPVKLANVTAAGFFDAPLAAESIAAAFGLDLATATEQAKTLPLPKTLGNATLTVKDSAGNSQQAPLFFASGTQINYQVPPGTQPGTATVTVSNAAGGSESGEVEIVAVAPGLFAINADGLAAASVLRVKADGTQVVESIFSVDAAGTIHPVAIDVSQPNEHVYLVAYGTGFRNNGGAIAAMVGGLSVNVLYAGKQGGFEGLDQVNLLLPPALAHKGKVPFVIYSGESISNTVYLYMK